MENLHANPTVFDLQKLEKYTRSNANADIPVFHLVLVIVSVLLICCSIFTAIGIYLRVLHLSRRHKRKRRNVEDGNKSIQAAQPLRVNVEEC
ncbi:unnamed protein product [Bursaphelenchus xylophilus]|uniref:(pine wood nematode) hypothetical protein n=1 Tax=Bursaphelenchus xylophilus TaxID=6326 RepID=A0A1I7S5Z8_BURXY|nr:unnamed protein product [Bursaphelenchus xylophilus]CAG9082458.1 unnamed protein product [Bursaphelenchus xylophilus]